MNMKQIKQDYQIWKQAKAETKRCINAMNECMEKIKGAILYDEWKEYVAKVGKIHPLLKDKNTTVTDAEFSEKYADEMKQLQAKSCFLMTVQPSFDLGVNLLVIGDVVRCVNNHANGQIYEKHCAGCPKFNELVEYQMLATNVQLAREKQCAAKQVLLNNFRKAKTK